MMPSSALSAPVSVSLEESFPTSATTKTIESFCTRKILNNKKKQQESPILEVGNEKQEALKEVMNEDLMKTKEFSKEELIDKEETENLFDEEDV